MLRIVTGPFHPALDRAFVEDIRSCKADHPFAPLAVIVPSAALVEQLKQSLTHHEPRAFLNIHFLTFHQLALRLRDDCGGEAGAGPAPPLQLVDDFFFEQLVRQVVRRQLPGLEPLTRLPASPGTWKGLWATVRDLKDAVVDPATALKALSEGVFEEDDRTWLRALFTLHAATMEASRSLGIGSPDDLAATLGLDLSGTSFIRGMHRLFYYGFYDLSQVQLSFFQSVIRAAPTTLYFPLQNSPAFFFARQFFERHLLPLADSHEDRSGKGDPTITSERVELSVTHVIGVEEELATVCREILTLVEVNGYRFDEIGVVARTLEPYQARLESVFVHHLVPFTTTAGKPLSREPLIKVLLRLASLPLNDFDRSAMLDVVTSPFYRIPGNDSSTAGFRPDIWRSLVYTLGITKGEEEWRRLAESASSSILRDAAAARDEDDDQIRGETGQALQLTSLWELVSRLIQDCRALPAEGSIGTLTEAFVMLVQSHVSVPGLSDLSSHESPEPSDLTKVGSLIRSALDRLRELDPLGGDLSWREWVELFQRVVDETRIPIDEERHQGVQVLDAMTARGRNVRALFVLGMNEKLFPRYVREDPFLRDRQRVVLESTLGYKIDEKLAGHEEEVLLFELLSRSATNRLYLSYQRADEAGRVMAPSGFIAMAMRDPRFVGKPEESVPRRLTQRISAQPSIQDLLPAEELSLGCLLQGHDAGPVLEVMGRDLRLFEQGLATLKIIERESPELGPFDGIIGVQAATSPAAARRSFSPTALERYATCPFQYFADKVLKLEPVRRLQQDHLPPLTIGSLVHESLRLSYERLVLLEWPDGPLTEARLQSTVQEAVLARFAAHAASQGTRHALLWTMACEQVTALVLAAVASDQAEYLATGFRPVAFEAVAQGIVQLESDGPTVSLKIHGTLDRVDYRSDPPALRIVDYKFKQGNEISPVDRNLALSAVRGFRLQPPLYARMTLPSLPAATEVQLLFLAPQWKQQISRSTFEAGLWTGHTGALIGQTLSALIQGIANREFFILPDGYCDYCEFSGACRRHDAMAWWRSYRSPQARVLRKLRKQKVQDE
ncbi:MAG: PD-(D/E)XK nuclease family protein [Nitrospirota bacterium]|nr:PD-(D/E)XK nuclease family protein [Nitrospirota bacterium]MDP2381329.1 PD-(D/E)XK nuclease family protein [Nitrospirota bacterium]